MGGPGGLFAVGLLIVLLVAAIPYLVSINRVMSAINSIRGHIDGILENGVILTGELDGVPELLEVPPLRQRVGACDARLGATSPVMRYPSHQRKHKFRWRGGRLR